MAYKYFTKELLSKSNEIDLANIFPEKQESAKTQLGTNYSLPQIADWIRDSTDNFKKQENYIIDLDLAVRKLVFKYYDSTNKPNPFSEEIDFDVKGQPRIPSEVYPSGVKTGKSDVIEQITESLESQIQSAIENVKIMIEIEPDNEDYKQSLMQLELTLETLG